MSEQTLFRKIFLLAGLGCAALLAGGYYIQYQLFVEPCPLCILQRIVFFAIGIIFFIAAAHNPKALGVYVYSLLNMLVASLGAALASRQLWLQQLPPEQLPACTPSLDRLLKFNPLVDAVKLILQGSGECGEVKFMIFNLSLAHWSLFSFIGIALLCLVIIILQIKKRRS